MIAVNAVVAQLGGFVADDTKEYEGLEWDAAKSEATLAERGFDFAAAAEVFSGDYFEREGLRKDYCEQRFVAAGEVEGIIITVVWRHEYREAIQRSNSGE